jgi:hypothetical protein
MVNSPRVLEIRERLDLLQQHAGRQLMISRHFLLANVGRHFVVRHPARCSVLVHSGIILATRLRPLYITCSLSVMITSTKQNHVKYFYQQRA